MNLKTAKNKLIAVLVMLAVSLSAAAQERLDSMLINRNWGKTGVQFATSLVVNLTATTVLKNVVNCKRPDGSDYNSFPSRHSAVAFSLGLRASQILYQNSPWWVLGSQAAATAVGFERVIDKKHFPSDVLAGAAIGIGSACMGNLVGNLLYPSDREYLPDAYNDYQPGLDMVTSAIFPITHVSNGMTSRTALGASLRGRLPLGDNYGFSAALNLRSFPIYRGHTFINPMNTLGLAVGMNGYRLLSKRYALEYTLTAGGAKLFNCDGCKHSSLSFTMDADFGASMQLTERLAAGMTAGYGLMTMPRAVSMLSVSFFTRATL